MKVCFWLFIFVLLSLCGHLIAEEIPLYNGKVLDATVVKHDRKRLTLRLSDDKNIILRWDQVDRSFRLHPLFGEPRESAPSAKGGDGIGGMTVRARRMGLFSCFLVLSFCLFWSHIWALYKIDSLGESKGGLGLFTLVLGPVFGIGYIIKKKGFDGFFRKTVQGAPPALAENQARCLFYTWDNEELKANNKRASGLVVAQNVFARAVRLGASDVHLNTASDGVKVAYRVDGILRDPEVLAADIGRKVLAALKMAAGMDIANRYENQDGVCRFSADGVMYDLRVARAWSVEGETLVVRLLQGEGSGKSLIDFGMSMEMNKQAIEVTHETSGIVVLAGPTGSGKTTTIYALLRLIEGTGRNILTIEDPVELRLENATQISLNPKQGSTFAIALRAAMRHDPDVILVGEVRDSETMEVAFQAALTGHLVFTTIHATGILATFGRLQQLGLSSYMLNTGLQAIICQRLVRELCPVCREAYVAEEAELEFWGLTREEVQAAAFYRPVGCKVCSGSGYRGRHGVFRMIRMNNELRKLVNLEENVGKFQDTVEKAALGSVTGYARELLCGGITSPEELRQTIGMFDFQTRLGE